MACAGRPARRALRSPDDQDLPPGQDGSDPPDGAECVSAEMLAVKVSGACRVTPRLLAV